MCEGPGVRVRPVALSSAVSLIVKSKKVSVVARWCHYYLIGLNASLAHDDMDESRCSVRPAMLTCRVFFQVAVVDHVIS